jgi:hypothetical protein
VTILKPRATPKTGTEEILRTILHNNRAAVAWKLDAHDLDELSARDRHGERFSLRWIVVHMIEETARHAGHADILREQIDGTTGLYP